MTTVMQSSTAAIAVTLSALYAGAVGLEQAVALVIGQNIGTATSSAMAAVGASSTAKRLAVAYIAFKLIAAVVALLLFLPIVQLMVRAAASIDPVTLLAIYHTGYNVVGVAILLPLIVPFTRVIERIIPERGNPLTRCLDPASLSPPPSPWKLAAEQWPACSDRYVHQRRTGSKTSSAEERPRIPVTMGAASGIGCIAADARVSFTCDRPTASDEEQRWLLEHAARPGAHNSIGRRNQGSCQDRAEWR